MDEHIEIPVTLPVDADGFLRRECPTCEQEFKWFAHQDGDPDAELTDQYFCPHCGAAAGVDEWATPAQIQYAQGVAGPEIDRLAQDLVEDAFRDIKGISYTPNRDFSLGIPDGDPLVELDDDMVIVQTGCHPNEPVKVPVEAASQVDCLICGTLHAT